MNKYSKLVVLLVIVGLVAFMGSQVTIPYKPGVSPSIVVKTFANSQVDTVVWSREAGVSGAVFATEFKDSVSVSYVKVDRGYNGVYLPLAGTVARDSVVEFRNFVNAPNKSNPDTVMAGTILLVPLADQFRFIVTYAASGNGTSNNTVVYEIVKQYSAK
jgi:hypothetical protein